MHLRLTPSRPECRYSKLTHIDVPICPLDVQNSEVSSDENQVGPSHADDISLVDWHLYTSVGSRTGISNNLSKAIDLSDDDVFIAYFSKHLTEVRYFTTEKEAFAIVQDVKNFYNYI